MLNIEKNENKNGNFVYDISLSGTAVNALGSNIIANTDGFNFQKPKNSDTLKTTLT